MADLDTTPYWSAFRTGPSAKALAHDISVDVLVVGGGITGLTTAYLLAKAGKRVAVIDRARRAAVDTGHTSAHLTMVTDVRLSELTNSFGADHAQAVWDAGLAAIAQIETAIAEHGIDADFARVDGYLHPASRDGSDTAQLEKDASLADEYGFDAAMVDDVPLVGGPGIRFSDQARFHPRKYLAGLIDAIVQQGGQVYEHSNAESFAADPNRATVNGHTVTFDDVVIATHNPLTGLAGVAGAALFQTKLFLYTSYVIAGRVAAGTMPDALWWDTGDPYHYLRVDPRPDSDVVIFGGEDHKTGQNAEPGAAFTRLEARLRALVPGVKITHHWSGQVIETPDGLPYIGATADHQYAATGFSGNGLTFGTVAGLVIADLILQRANPWTKLFDPDRTALTHGLWDYLKENADYPYYMIRDRFAGADSRSLRAVKRGEGRIIERKGVKVAAYRDASGTAIMRSAKCTHLGCLVGWNAAEHTWDCPCHGSRFKPNGDVISGPAEAPLEEIR